ncbi:MAG: hypothetical protein ACTHNP_03955 [Solirubrobacterales bacterium]
MEEAGAAPVAIECPAISEVSLAFGLGWDMTYLFTYVGDKESGLEDVRDRLPSLARLPERQRSLIRLDRIRGPVRRFRSQFEAVGVRDLPDAKETERQLLSKRTSVEAVRRALCNLHYGLMRAFATADNRLAKAYRLGRSLATTCHIAGDEAALRREFDPHRLARLDEWLADLASQFPPHTSRPVRLSLSAWRRWIDNPLVNRAEAGDPLDGWRHGRFRSFGWGERTLDWERDGERVRQALRRQGDIWRALLSGEKRGEAMLELPDFLRAAQKIPPRTIRLLGVMSTPLAVSVALACGGVLLAVGNDDLLQSVLGAGLAFLGAAGAIGFTWRGPLEIVRRSTAELKKPLWGAVLDEEIAKAITKRPQGAIFGSEDAAVAAPAVGPPLGL